MSSTATCLAPGERVEVLFAELAELAGQRNAIDGRVVEIVAELDRDELWGATGARSVAALVGWKLGVSSNNANTIAAVAHRLEEFPRCTQGLREGRLSLDQVGVIAGRAGEGSDEHYAQLAASATVSQLRTAVNLEPRPDPAPECDPRPEPRRSLTKTTDEESTFWKITLPHAEAAKFDAALQSHLDALVAQWKLDHAGGGGVSDQAPPLPGSVDAFMSLIEAGWDTEVARRPQGQHTTVVVHLDVQQRTAALHLGPLLSDEQRQYLLCDATCEVWFERDGQVIGSGRATRTISRRLRRALEHRDRSCVVPGCGATRGLHAHHIRHWEDGGTTDLSNLVLLCTYHHRMRKQHSNPRAGSNDHRQRDYLAPSARRTHRPTRRRTSLDRLTDRASIHPRRTPGTDCSRRPLHTRRRIGPFGIPRSGFRQPNWNYRIRRRPFSPRDRSRLTLTVSLTSSRDLTAMPQCLVR